MKKRLLSLVVTLAMLLSTVAQTGMLTHGTFGSQLLVRPLTGDTAYHFNFDACTASALAENFIAYNSAGDSVWTCTVFGRNSSGGMQANGFNGATNRSEVNEDWLISPPLDLSGMTFPLLNFSSVNRFAGPSLRLMVSVNYAGSGDPARAKWTELNGEFPLQNTSQWKLSDSINLSAFRQARVYLAWVYRSDTSAAARWTLDDISIINSPTAPAPGISANASSLDFGYITRGDRSAWKPLEFGYSDFTGNLVLAVPDGFEIAKDSLLPGKKTIGFAPVELGNATSKTVYLRFAPHLQNRTFSGFLRAEGAALNRQLAMLQGTSLSTARTLEVVNWNIEWFGSAESNLGPADKNRQAANVQTILRALDADIYALAEVVDTARFRALADALGPDFGSVVAGYGTRATDPGSPFFTENYAKAQKLGYIYRKSVVSNVRTRPLLMTTVADTLVPSSYHWWSSGRFPFLMEADVTLEGVTRRINLVLLHAKANTGSDEEKVEAYMRRKNGALNLKDTLDTHFDKASIIILGDFNDELDRTIAPTTGSDTVSSYQAIVEDSLDANSYRSVTLPFSRADMGSSVGRTTTIDNVVVSNELAPFLIDTQLRSDVVHLVAFNASAYGNTTSDHFPVMTRYRFTRQGARCFLKRLFGPKSK